MECNEVMHQESTSLYQQMSKKDSQDWMDGWTRSPRRKYGEEQDRDQQKRRSE